MNLSKALRVFQKAQEIDPDNSGILVKQGK
jgi:Flp pilus assembly protein TadD